MNDGRVDGSLSKKKKDNILDFGPTTAAPTPKKLSLISFENWYEIIWAQKKLELKISDDKEIAAQKIRNGEWQWYTNLARHIVAMCIT